jgi:uncharacterized membrane protein YgcG
MKTIYQTSIKKYQLLVFSILSIGITSCGSFKNSSYDDTDGIYSSTSNRETTIDDTQVYTQEKPKSVYAEKFKQMEEDLYETEYFTDVDSYTSNQVDTVYVVESSYAGWGNNTNQVNVNYYNNGWNNWGYGYNSWYGPGWNNSFYYGNTWGLGFNYGWNNWGWNNWGNPYYGNGWNNWYSPYYGYNNFYGGFNNNVSYNAGRRGMNGYYPANSGRSSGRTATVSGRNAQIGNSTVRNPRTRTSTTREYDSNNSPRSTTTPRNTTSPRTISTPRSTTTPRNTTTPRSTTTPRNDSPRTISTPRSSGSSSGSFGGGSSSGGGGRSSGGGGSRGGGRGGF